MLLHIIFMFYQTSTNVSDGNKTKMLRPRLRPKVWDRDQDRGRAETGLVI